MKMRLVRAFKGCIADADKNFADVANERLNNPPPSEHHTTTHLTPVTPIPPKTESITDMLLQPVILTVASVINPRKPKKRRTNVQLYVTVADDFATAAERSAHHAQNRAPRDDNLKLLSPSTLWTPGKPRQRRREEVYTLKRYGEKEGTFVVLLTAKSCSETQTTTTSAETPAPAVTQAVTAAPVMAFPALAVSEQELASAGAVEATITRRRVRTARPPSRLIAASA